MAIEQVHFNHENDGDWTVARFGGVVTIACPRSKKHLSVSGTRSPFVSSGMSFDDLAEILEKVKTIAKNKGVDAAVEKERESLFDKGYMTITTSRSS